MFTLIVDLLLYTHGRDELATHRGVPGNSRRKAMFNLYGNASSAAEQKGQLLCDMSSSSIPEFSGAIEFLNSEPAAAGVWVQKGSTEFYIERA